MCVPASGELAKVKQELRNVIRFNWSRETVAYLGKKLEEAELDSRIYANFGEILIPFIENEDHLRY